MEEKGISVQKAEKHLHNLVDTLAELTDKRLGA
jgi:hypothetical protein